MITDDIAKTTISHNIKEILRVLGWNVRKLVYKSGIPQNTVYCITRGVYVPNAVHLKNIADALNVTTDRLLEIPEELLENPEEFKKVG